MAPTRNDRSPRFQAPKGYNYKRVVDGLEMAAHFKRLYPGLRLSTPPLRLRSEIPPASDPRGPAKTLQDFECVRELGTGGNGRVFLVRTRDHAAQLFALKSVAKKALRQIFIGEHPEDTSRERLTLVDMPWNAFVSGLLQTFYDDRNIYMLLEYPTGGTLHDLIDAHRDGMPPSLLIFYFANIMCALEHLQRTGFVHRDLKPSNILVGADGYLLLCDFGATLRALPYGEHDTGFYNGEGTVLYQAPEAWDPTKQPDPSSVRFGAAIDWWAAGITLFEMATGDTPYDPRDCSADLEPGDAILNQILTVPLASRWPPHRPYGRKLKSLVAGLLTFDANARLGACGGFDEVRRHPWLAPVDWKKMRRKWYIPPFLGKPPPEYGFALGSDDRHPLKKHRFPGLRFAN
ncbi:Protein kinase domain-containing protein [Mycena kentingensis (nom. inval.)]|nr:Protein kinase domain-containing protein [Mycena kentingensis (nom. inval.)]